MLKSTFTWLKIVQNVSVVNKFSLRTQKALEIHVVFFKVYVSKHAWALLQKDCLISETQANFPFTYSLQHQVSIQCFCSSSNSSLLISSAEVSSVVVGSIAGSSAGAALQMQWLSFAVNCSTPFLPVGSSNGKHNPVTSKQELTVCLWFICTMEPRWLHSFKCI